MASKKNRIYQKNEKSAEQVALEKAVRERFQRERPSLDDLIASGEYRQSVKQAECFTMMELAAGFKKSREEQQLSLADVASRSGIDKAAISRLENGQADNPTIATLTRLAASVGKRLRFVLEDEPAAAH